MLHRRVSIVTLLLCNITKVVGDYKLGKFQKYPVSSMGLQTIFSSFRTESLVTCCYLCSESPECNSFNYIEAVGLCQFSTITNVASDVAVLLGSVVYSKAFEGCQTDWSEHDGGCFKLFKETLMTYDEARDRCVVHNAHLASIKDSKEQEFLKGELQKVEHWVERIWSGLWIGAKDDLVEDEFIWSAGDGSPLDPTLNWAYSQPDDYGNQDCVNLMLHPYYVGTIHDVPCNGNMEGVGYICKSNY